MGTNSVEVGGIEISGNITVNGQVAVGPGVSDPSTVVDINGGSAIISGTPPIVSQQVALPMPEVAVPPGVPCTDLAINGSETVVLSAAVGNYCFNTLSVSGGGTLTVDGPVKVYVTTLFHAIGNTQIGVPSNPAYLTMLLVSDSQATIEGSMSGTTEFYGGLYAPSAHIDVGGDALIYGSIIARTVGVSGDAQIHYDESLGELTDPIGLYRIRILSWREL